MDELDSYRTLFGTNDKYIKLIEDQTKAKISLRGTELIITGQGEGAVIAQRAIEKLLYFIRTNEPVDLPRIRYILSLAKANRLDEFDDVLHQVIATTHRGKKIKAKTLGQQEYVQNIRHKTLTFGIGPAGTGKTYLAMAMAVMALKSKQVERIVLTRPAVEAGEKLGFLPGDLAQKVDPYLRPLYDALYEMVGSETYQRLTEKGIIEVAPLAYMRGRTLSDSFVILDEAQNTSTEQMKMFLTRLGFNAKMVVTGDITQMDLPIGKKSGLIEALEVLTNIPDIGITRLTKSDVVRHELVQTIVEAYET
ncbi:MAG: phosphate starvation-inducible protein PhoH, partial [Clostridiales bacterium]|nr:phosphate starvation-inducible protein PhoH [Clostridiales bacterium]